MTTDEGWTFYPDDVVCFSERHYNWMMMAARWPSVHLARTSLVGRVVDSTRKTVTVIWQGVAGPQVHFPENLELLIPHNHEKGQTDDH